MSETYLTADEIYAIDKLTENDLPDYLITLTPEKQKLVTHIFSKNRTAMAWKVIADEKEEGANRLLLLLKENGVIPV